MSDDNRKAEKQRLRSRYLEIRRQINPEQAEYLSNAIRTHLQSLSEYINAHTIHTYISMNHRNEVDTRKLISEAMLTGKDIVAPKMKEQSKLDHIKLKDLSEIKKNSWGIPEPTGKKEADLSNIDLVIVPMLSGDFKKNRLGYGKGYYDRFLKKIEAVKIGILFDIQFYEGTLPVNRYDVALDILITENKII